MAIKKTQQGFALLIAIIFMSVMLSFGLTLGALAYKQQILASNAVESQYAFYAADAALECALYADQQLGSFVYPVSDPGAAPALSAFCGGLAPVSSSEVWSTSKWVVSLRVSLDANKHCADVTVYKYKDPDPVTHITAYLFSQGYNVSCTTLASPGGARLVSRGLNASY